MKTNKIACILLSACLALHIGCATPGSSDSSSGDSEFADFDSGSSSGSADAALEQEISASESAADSQSTENSAADEFAEFDNQQSEPAATNEAPPPEIAAEPVPEDDLLLEPEATPTPAVAAAEPVAPPVVEEPIPMPTPEAAPAPQASRLAEINRLQFKSNDNGGTLMIEADQPITYVTRANAQLNQFVIEIPQSKLSAKAKRTLNTKDFPGGIGSIDPYQTAGSTTSRIVIQLRDGAAEPTVQMEGNKLLVMSQNVESTTVAKKDSGAASGADMGEGSENFGEGGDVAIAEGPKSRILTSASLQEFLSGNQKFYGKKISIEANDADLQEVFKFISEESGANLVLNEDVKGKVSLKLKQVPWDQALVVLMKSKKLGYSRQGQILRIAKLEDLKKEEDDFASLSKSKQGLLPLTIKMIPVSYAKVDDLVKQVTPFLSDRGKVIAEARTSAVVISDVPEVISRVEKLVQSLDIAPAQVLIEGKVVEARETFQRFIGVNWGASGENIDVGSSSSGTPTRVNAGNFRIDGIGSTVTQGNFTFSLGTLDFLGDLQATLGLGEKSGNVKVLSSPRVLTLHNEKAVISQESELPIISTVLTQAGLPQKSITFKPVKLKLDVTPQVTNDASVILAVEVAREFADGVVDQETQARPVNKREAKTKVIVKNGQTAVIGGIYQTDLSEGENYVPGLGKIPVVGWLFKAKTTTREKNELLIFLTPRILGMADSGISAPPTLSPSHSEAPASETSDGDLAL